MRFGFILGFLVGGGIASLLARPEEMPAGDEPLKAASQAAGAAAAQVHPVIDRVKHQLDEARDAAHEAQLEKEAEMLRLYDAMIHRKDVPEQA